MLLHADRTIGLMASQGEAVGTQGLDSLLTATRY